MRFDQSKGFFEAEGQRRDGLGQGARALAPTSRTRSTRSSPPTTSTSPGIAPFADAAVNDLTGTLNADAKVHLTPDPSQVNMSGSVVLTNGGMEVPAIGEELNKVQAKISMHPDRHPSVLEDMEADPATGHVKITGQAKMAGLEFKSAKAHIAIKNGQEIPISSQGVEFGDAWGQIDATVTNSPKLMNVDVSIPQLHMHLPESTGHSVQALPGDPTIDIGHRTPDGKLALLELAPPAKVTAPGDSETKILRQARSRRVHRPRHHAEDRRDGRAGDRHEGERDDHERSAPAPPERGLPRGERQALRDRQRHGELHRPGGQPGHQRVGALGRARRRSDAGHRRVPRAAQDRAHHLALGAVAVGERDPLAHPLRVERWRRSAPGGDANSGAGGDTAKGVGMAGGVATQAINSAISGVTGDSVTTRVDTSESDNPRPDIGWQISHSIAAHFVVNLGLPAPGDNPDQELLLVDWRFVRNWMLEGTVGDAGSSLLDLSWRWRY